MAAKTKAEVDSQSAADRAWDSLNYSYDQKAKKINQNYDKAYSQASNQQLARGMQRSSYAGQVLAGVNQQRNQALSDNEDALIADYQKWRYQIDRDEVEDSKWWNEFNEKARQFNATHELNREVASNNYNVQLEQLNQSAQRLALDNTIASNNYNIANMQNWISQQGVNNDYALGLAKLSQGDRQLDLQQQQINNQASQWATEQEDKRNQLAIDNAFRQSEADREQGNINKEFNYKQERDTIQDIITQTQLGQSQQQIDNNFALESAQLAQNDKHHTEDLALQYAQLNEEKRQFNENIDWDRAKTDKQYASNYAMTMIQNGFKPSKELLAAAGISETDAETMYAWADQAMEERLKANDSGSGGNNSGNNTPPPGDKDEEEKPTDNDVFNWLTATPQERKEQLDKTGKTGKEYLKAGYDATKAAFNDWAKEFFTGKKSNKK